MAKGWNYRSGDWRAICDSCGEKHYASELRQRWDGFKVCSECWEPRHSQDFLRTKPDNQTVPWSRPQTTDTFKNNNGTGLEINGTTINSTRI